ncbi:hypothetical protein RHD99_13905 [Buttiauxella selenatireducens]|uniref:Uncharacterized protein n=1 Tax=Buttiauxella selenatireducens TaxID=3073902 RepID=A0ABY9S4Z4_9ENTR|nr:hypothetical protein [Buttiauxella sp. R73]WMY72574.1 hypothetical protein RHD99_13905 [Buttiauxella sp. R73]
MKKRTKIALTILFVILALLTLFISFMAVGMGVSGSGCGVECSETVANFQLSSCIFWFLGLLTAIWSCINPNAKKTDAAFREIK